MPQWLKRRRRRSERRRSGHGSNPGDPDPAFSIEGKLKAESSPALLLLDVDLGGLVINPYPQHLIPGEEGLKNQVDWDLSAVLAQREFAPIFLLPEVERDDSIPHTHPADL
jgi:hypothetical protein